MDAPARDVALVVYVALIAAAVGVAVGSATARARSEVPCATCGHPTPSGPRPRPCPVCGYTIAGSKEVPRADG